MSCSRWSRPASIARYLATVGEATEVPGGRPVAARRIGRAACYAARCSVRRTRAQGVATGQARRSHRRGVTAWGGPRCGGVCALGSRVGAGSTRLGGGASARCWGQTGGAEGRRWPPATMRLDCRNRLVSLTLRNSAEGEAGGRADEKRPRHGVDARRPTGDYRQSSTSATGSWRRSSTAAIRRRSVRSPSRSTSPTRGSVGHRVRVRQTFQRGVAGRDGRFDDAVVSYNGDAVIHFTHSHVAGGSERSGDGDAHQWGEVR